MQVCGAYDFVSSAFNNVAILATKEKIVEGFRRQAKLVVWCSQLGCVVAWDVWLRGCVGALFTWVRGCVSCCRGPTSLCYLMKW